MKIIIHYTKRGVVVCAIILLATGAAIAIAVQNDDATAPSRIALSPVSVPLQQNNEGPVDVKVTHDAKQSTEKTHVFTVVLDTHSGDLSTFDTQTNIMYRSSQGQEIPPQSIGGDRETHHRTITVTFANTALPGTLVVKNLRGVPERPFFFAK